MEGESWALPIGSMYGIYANIGGIMMGSMLPYIAYMDPVMKLVSKSSFSVVEIVLGYHLCGICLYLFKIPDISYINLKKNVFPALPMIQGIMFEFSRDGSSWLFMVSWDGQPVNPTGFLRWYPKSPWVLYLYYTKTKKVYWFAWFGVSPWLRKAPWLCAVRNVAIHFLVRSQSQGRQAWWRTRRNHLG